MDCQKRYKHRGLNFNSAEDARVLRAISSQMSRKTKRDEAMVSRRRMDAVDGSAVKSVQKESSLRNRSVLANISGAFPNKKDREAGLQRYEQLLKWKEEKRKKLNIEKRRRKPSFKTGVFEPDQPKFLVSENGKVENTGPTTPAKTPFKYLQRSSTKYGFTPGGSALKKVPRFCTGVTPAATAPKIPKFGLRLTPSLTQGRSAFLQNKIFGQKENNSSALKKAEAKTRTSRRERSVRDVDMKRVLRGRNTRQRKVVVKDDEDLGVKALPATPVNTHPRRSRRSVAQLSAEVGSLSLDENAAPTSTVCPSPEVAAKIPLTSQEIPSFAPENFAFNFRVEPKLDDRVQKEKDAAFESDKKNSAVKENMHDSESENGDHNETFEIEYRPTEKVLSEKSATPKTRLSRTRRSTLGKSDQMIQEQLMINTSSRTTDSQENARLSVHDYSESKMQTSPSNIETDADSSQDEEIQTDVKPIDEEMGEEKIKNKEDEGSSLKKYDFVVNVADVHYDTVETFEGYRHPNLVTTENCCDLSFSNITPLVSRRITRRSARLSSCIDSSLTPMSRLRPRTPCSRSTRRSMSAHTDFPMDVSFTRMQASAKKSVRRSNAKSSRKSNAKRVSETLVKNISDEIEECRDVSQILNGEPCLNTDSIIEEEEKTPVYTSDKKQEEIPLDTPGDSSAKKMQEKIPYETPSRNTLHTPKSSSRRSKVSWLVRESPYVITQRGSGRRSEVPADIKSLFDDIPTDGSPLPAHLTPLLNKSYGEQIQRPRDEGQSPCLPSVSTRMSLAEGAPVSPVEEQTYSNLWDLLKPSSPPVRNDTPDIDVWGDESPEKQDMVEELPSTDSVVPITEFDLKPVTRRRSTRASLLPGMSDSPIVTSRLSIVTEDLISFETPMIPKRKCSKIPVSVGKATPSRRSRRLSKACPE